MQSSFLSLKNISFFYTLFLMGILTSCDIGYSQGTSSSSTTVSWKTGDGYKKIKMTSNGNERSLEANQPIQLEGGVISAYERGLTIKLKEEMDGVDCKAELKEVDGVLKLFVEEGELIRKFYEDENTWLDDFLSVIGEKNGSEERPCLSAKAKGQGSVKLEEMLDSIKSVKGPMPSPELKLILKGLKSISLSSSRKEILDALLDKELEAGDHVAVAESVFQNISLSSDRTYLILKLIKHQEISVPAREYIIENINTISLSSQREEILMAILKK